MNRAEFMRNLINRGLHNEARSVDALINELVLEIERLRNQAVAGNDWLTGLGEVIITNKKRHGWRVTVPGDFELDPEHVMSNLMLITTEVSEAAEAVRKNDLVNFTDELADVAIRLIGLSYGMEIDLRAAILSKIEKNSMREYRHGGKRL